MTEDKSKEMRDRFSRKMIEVLNFGALNLAMGIGYRLGLFEVLDGLDDGATPEEIAARSGLSGRYVREWLAVMLCGGIIEQIQKQGEPVRYILPKAHGDFLTRRSGNGNMGVYTQEIPLLTSLVMERVVEGFRTGHGVPYECYPSFQAFMTELSNAKHQDVLVEKFLPQVDDGRMVRRLKEGIRVCDLGCGEGLAVILMARAFPRSRFVGIDLDDSCIRTGDKQAAQADLSNVEFLVHDAACLEREADLAGSFDYITAFDAIHDQTQPAAALRGAYHLLGPGGSFSMVDIAAQSDPFGNRDHPMGPFLYTVSLMHCMPVGLVDGGAGLGMMWGKEQAVRMLGEAGFEQVEVKEIPNDPFNLHYFCKKR
nr:class I SAM-dependent methyltransferase [uncultured Sphaerochaeta sp.]